MQLLLYTLISIDYFQKIPLYSFSRHIFIYATCIGVFFLSYVMSSVVTHYEIVKSHGLELASSNSAQFYEPILLLIVAMLAFLAFSLSSGIGMLGTLSNRKISTRPRRESYFLLIFTIRQSVFYILAFITCLIQIYADIYSPGSSVSQWQSDPAVRLLVVYRAQFLTYGFVITMMLFMKPIGIVKERI